MRGSKICKSCGEGNRVISMDFYDIDNADDCGHVGFAILLE